MTTAPALRDFVGTLLSEGNGYWLRRSRPMNGKGSYPLVPGIYNLILQSEGGARFVAEPLRPLITDESSPIRWLYKWGCHCEECHNLNLNLRDASQRITRLGPRDSAVDETIFNDAVRAVSEAGKEVRQHELKVHDGDRILFNELPSLEVLDAIARQFPPEAFRDREPWEEQAMSFSTWKMFGGYEHGSRHDRGPQRRRPPGPQGGTEASRPKIRRNSGSVRNGSPVKEDPAASRSSRKKRSSSRAPLTPMMTPDHANKGRRKGKEAEDNGKGS